MNLFTRIEDPSGGDANSSEIKASLQTLYPSLKGFKRVLKLGSDENALRVFEAKCKDSTPYHLIRNSNHEVMCVPASLNVVDKIRSFFKAGKDLIQVDGYGSIYYSPLSDSLYYSDSDCGHPAQALVFKDLVTNLYMEAEGSPTSKKYICLGTPGKQEPDDIDYETFGEEMDHKYPLFEYRKYEPADECYDE